MNNNKNRQEQRRYRDDSPSRKRHRSNDEYQDNQKKQHRLKWKCIIDVVEIVIGIEDDDIFLNEFFNNLMYITWLFMLHIHL